MTIAEKIEEMDLFTDKSITIGHYNDWYVSSFKSKIFDNDDVLGTRGDTFEEAVNNAYEIYLKEKNRIKNLLAEFEE